MRCETSFCLKPRDKAKDDRNPQKTQVNPMDPTYTLTFNDGKEHLEQLLDFDINLIDERKYDIGVSFYLGSIEESLLREVLTRDIFGTGMEKPSHRLLK